MRAYEVKRVAAGSVFRFNFCAGFVVGLIACVVLLVLGYSLKDVGIELGTYKGFMGAGSAVLGAILGSVVNGLMAGIGGAILALIYNLFAAAVGGVTVGLDDGG